MPAVGLYYLQVESHLNDEFVTSRRINFYPWVQWNPNVIDRVTCIQPDSELCHRSMVQSLSDSMPCLQVSNVGLMSDIPAVSRHLTDEILFEGKVNEADDYVLYKHATASQLAAADDLLSVLSEAVRLRVMYQDAKCHICLLQKFAADADSRIVCSDFALPYSSNTSPDEVASGNFIPEILNDCDLRCSQATGMCDVKAASSDDAAMSSSCCDHISQMSTPQSHCSTSNGEVHNIANILVLLELSVILIVNFSVVVPFHWSYQNCQ